MESLRNAYGRLAGLARELAKFGTVGAIAFVIDYGGTNLLRFGFDWGPLKSKIAATVIAATFAYLGNRHWTFKDREQSGLAREYFLFFVLNGIGLLISLLIIGFVTYTLDLQDALSYNIALILGTAIGTLFRFWSYKKWVFLAPVPPVALVAPVAPVPLTAPVPLEDPAAPAPRSPVNGHAHLLDRSPEENVRPPRQH